MREWCKGQQNSAPANSLDSVEWCTLARICLSRETVRRRGGRRVCNKQIVEMHEIALKFTCSGFTHFRFLFFFGNFDTENTQKSNQKSSKNSKFLQHFSRRKLDQKIVFLDSEICSIFLKISSVQINLYTKVRLSSCCRFWCVCILRERTQNQRRLPQTTFFCFDDLRVWQKSILFHSNFDKIQEQTRKHF